MERFVYNGRKSDGSYGLTDDLTMSYSGNRLIRVVDAALPFAEPGISTASAASVSRDTTEYIGDFVFRNGVLDRLLFRGGYMDIAGGVPRYHYFATDHLGSVRTVYGEDGVAEQLLTYDLFGGIIPELSTGMGMQPYGYNGKELDHTHGLDWYDYGARYYDSPIGRWTTMDPLCEKYYNVSPYVYCHNNPVNMTDPDGMDDYQLSRDGCFILLNKTDDNYNVIYSTTSNGNIDYKTSVNIEKGIIEEKIQRNILGQTSSNMSGNKTFNYTVDFYNFSDNESAISVFEFAAKNTDVEWSRTTIKSNNTTNTIVATSHFDGGEVGMVYLLNDIKGNNTLTPCNGEIIENSHNHRLYNYTVSIGDKKYAESIDKMFPNAQISIYTIDRYVPYNKKSEAGLLEEQVVKYKR